MTYFLALFATLLVLAVWQENQGIKVDSRIGTQLIER